MEELKAQWAEQRRAEKEAEEEEKIKDIASIGTRSTFAHAIQ